MNVHLVTVLATLAIGAVFGVQSAAAAPFSLEAVYEALPLGSAPEVRYPLTGGALIPDGGENFRLVRVVARFSDDAQARHQLALYEELRFQVTSDDDQCAGENCGRRTQTGRVSRTELEKLPGAARTIFEWSHGLRSGWASVPLRVEFEAIVRTEDLCRAERDLIVSAKDEELLVISSADLGKGASPKAIPKECGQKPKLESMKRCLAHYLVGEWQTRLPRREGRPILASFCGAPGSRGGELWKHAVQLPDQYGCNGLDGDKCMRRHETWLLELIRPKVAPDASIVDGSAEQSPKLAVRTSSTFQVVRSIGAFLTYEETSSSRMPLSQVVDQHASILISLDERVCTRVKAGVAFEDPYHIELEEREETGKKAVRKAALVFRDGCERRVDVDLRQLLDKEVTLRIRYRLTDDLSVLLKQEHFVVRQLGWTVLLQGVTDIKSAAEKDAPNDFGASGRIALAWAFYPGASEGERRNEPCVLVPVFEFSHNSRESPTTSRIFTGYVGIAALGGSNKPDWTDHLGFGFGISVGRLLYTAVMWTPGESNQSDPMVVVGLAGKGVAELFRKWGAP